MEFDLDTRPVVLSAGTHGLMVFRSHEESEKRQVISNIVMWLVTCCGVPSQIQLFNGGRLTAWVGAGSAYSRRLPISALPVKMSQLSSWYTSHLCFYSSNTNVHGARVLPISVSVEYVFIC